ncbi:MAG: hypothetical protein FWD64_02870 [Acidobacteriaceae bacterium]|nr:hypothetical protein [Acidobacteriaceae bacterium]
MKNNSSQDAEVPMCTSEEINTFLLQAEGNPRIAIVLMLMCGMSLEEVVFASFADIDFTTTTIKIGDVSLFDYPIVDCPTRLIQIPDVVVGELHQWQLSHPAQTLILETPNGGPIPNLSYQVKNFVFLHQLNCEGCKFCKTIGSKCEDWNHDEYRGILFTSLLSHDDLKAVRKMAGHKDVSEATRYL